jgi:hypothetical protein
VAIYGYDSQNWAAEEKKGMNAGLITYHAAYNYGSVLQAFATQVMLERLGCKCHVINYRFKGQKDFYTIVRTKYGLKIFLLDAIQFPAFKDKRIRQNKFESFIGKNLNLTELIDDPDNMEQIANLFDIYISGGDQIWSKYSSELYHEDWRWMNPYLLVFTNKKKISYATSIGSMNRDDLFRIKSALCKYSHIAVRENSAAETLSNFLSRKINYVLDPTLLLDAHDYNSLIELPRYNEKFILYYTLRGFKEVSRQRKDLLKLSVKYQMPIYAITPFCYFLNSKNYINVISAGIEEFLGYIKSSQLVITDSFHGSAFSIIFQKKFYSICKGWDTDYRKSELLNCLGLNNRISNSISDCDIVLDIDYCEVEQKLNELKKESLKYLNNALES